MTNCSTMGNETSIAILGIGCRFPGGIESPASFWDFLANGNDAITEVPEDRWSLKSFYDPDPSRKGKTYTKKGGFLTNIRGFDPQFFAISPREANFMDPQQRLLLETTWEALEDGGMRPENLRGSRTGVYVGLFVHDYENMHFQPSENKLSGPHSATGMSTTIDANRISYCFDFIGPSLVVDTACSSSLVAVHLACNSLLGGEIDLALAGGANAILRPEMSISLCQAGMLSPDGYCKSFDERANGYTRAEGVGMIALKRLSDAERDGDPIYAVIRATAVNQDGGNDGLNIPNGSSQKKAILEALAASGLAASDIQYVEAHGTGTPVGDPVECEAIGEVYGKAREAESPCFIGSVKSNIGHTESTAGVAGVIKLALMLKHRSFVPNLHFGNPNPVIDFDRLHLRVSTALTEWEAWDHSRVGAINSFGFGGTNAHAVVQEYEQAISASSSSQTNRSPMVLPISATSKDALKAVAQQYLDYLRNHPVHLPDVAHTLALRKGHHPFRLGIVTDNQSDFVLQLEAFLADQKSAAIRVGTAASASTRKVAFVYSGMGQQWPEMGKQLLRKEPIFREVVEQCDREFRKHTEEWSLIDELSATDERSRMQKGSKISQPCIFAVQAGLTAVWASLGLSPGAVVGHSVGEVAAFYVAGVLSLEDAITVSFYRGLLQHQSVGTGKMLAVGMSREDAERRIADTSDKVSIAALNSPTSTTISGDANVLEELAFELEQEDVFARFLNVDIPFHSPAMEEHLEKLFQRLTAIRPRTASVPVVSTVTGGFVDGDEVNAAYWRRNVRGTVDFLSAFHRLITDEFTYFIEISAHPVLSMAMRENLSAAGVQAVLLPSMRRQEDETSTIRTSIADLYCHGYPLEWNAINAVKGNFVRLPSYPFQRQEYWNESDESREERLGQRIHGSGNMVGIEVHPLLGGRLESPDISWQSAVGPSRQGFLDDHKVQKTIVFPGAGYVELALAAAREMNASSSAYSLEGMKIESPLILHEDTEASVQVRVLSDKVSIYSQARPGSWGRHFVGTIGATAHKSSGPLNIQEITSRCPIQLDRSAAYERFANDGLEYGPCFQGIQRLWVGEGEVLGEIEVDRNLIPDLDDYVLHPVILDACFQAAITLVHEGTYLPVGLDRLSVYRSPGPHLFTHVRLTEQTGRNLGVDISVCDPEGNVIVSLENLRTQRVEEGPGASKSHIGDIFHEYRWLSKPLGREPDSANASFLPAPGALREMLQPRLEDYTTRFEREKYYCVVEPKLDRLCTQLILTAFETLGLRLSPKESFEENEIREHRAIAGRHTKLFHRFLEILEEEGYLKSQDSRWEVLAAPNELDALETWNRLVLEHPDHQAELNLILSCGSRLDGVLTGDVDPLSLIFPPNSTATEQLYRDSPTFRVYNHIVREQISRLLEALPQGRVIRVLEVGAGTGSLTSYVLPYLPADHTKYVFTDISLSFINQAQARFKDFPFVEYAAYDLEKGAGEQGFEPGSFDLILASDAVHATRDLRKTTRALRDLLVPGGHLVLLEATSGTRWFDLVFGTLPGWWLFEDMDLRPSHPLMPFDRWSSLLREVGFASVADLSDCVEKPLHTVVVAQTRSTKTGVEELEPPPVLSRPCILLSDSQGVGEMLVASFESPIVIEKGNAFRKTGTNRFEVNPAAPHELKQAFCDAADRMNEAPVVLCMWDLDNHCGEITTSWLREAVDRSCIANLTILQAVAEKEWPNRPDLFFVTAGAQPVGNDAPLALAQTPTRGLARVAVSELNKVNTRQVDLSARPTPREIAALAHEIQVLDAEDEIALRGSHRYVSRLVRSRPETSGKAYRIRKPHTQKLDDFCIAEIERRAPGAGEVEIEVAAAALNFKDLARVTGIIDAEVTEDGEISSLGLECAGRITAVGEGVSHLRVGDAVMGLVRNGFSSHTVTDACTLIEKPDSISFEEAATVPVAFAAAHYALMQLGNLKKGERVLIHTATGGLGLAAIQIARAQGAEVLATAGMAEKRQLLKAIGIDYVGDSRSLEFVEEIREYLSGETIDLIINTLPGTAIEKGLSLLCPIKGRFFDMGNFYSDYSLPLSSMKNGVHFTAFDLQLLAVRQPELFRDTLNAVTDSMEAGDLHPLPHRTFPSTAAADAFALMKSARHTGKILLSFQESGVKSIADIGRFQPDANGVYLITGGLGGFGLATAQWLAFCGARYLVLTGRSGASSEIAKATVADLEAAGVEVIVEAADASDEQRMREVIDQIDKRGHPLKGVMHAAMVLEDVTLREMTPEQMTKVLHPKIVGAWILHSLTKERGLDFFLSFSSFSALVGAKSQGNYSAANAFLDSLSHYQSELGIPGTSVCWGSIGEVGYVSQKEEITEYFRRQGVESIDPRQAWKVMVYMTEGNCINAGAIKIDWDRFAEYNPFVSVVPRFSSLLNPITAIDVDGEAAEGGTIAFSEDPEERQHVLVERLSVIVGELLGVPRDQLQSDISLDSFGFDSLMAVELSLGIQKVTGVELPKMALLSKGLDISGLASIVSGEYAKGISDKDRAASGTAPVGKEVERLIDELDVADIDTLLEEALEKEAV